MRTALTHIFSFPFLLEVLHSGRFEKGFYNIEIPICTIIVNKFVTSYYGKKKSYLKFDMVNLVHQN